MANKVLQRVWDHSQQRGAARCLVLAIADVADADGIAYPGVAYLAKMICEDEDYTFRLLRKVIATGELLHKPGGGRGKKTLYAVACGLPDAQIDRLNTVLQYRVSSDKNPVPESREKKNPGLQNTVIDRDKPWTLSDSKQATFDAPERDESPIGEKLIHDHDPHGGGGGDRARDQKTINPEFVRQLCLRRSQGRPMNPKSAENIARRVLAGQSDESTILASLDTLIAADTGMGAIVDLLNNDATIPPKGHPYVKPEQSARPVQPDSPPDRPRRSAKGSHNGTGGSDLKDPGWRERLIAQAEAGELP
jgi:hypothetical protein